LGFWHGECLKGNSSWRGYAGATGLQVYYQIYHAFIFIFYLGNVDLAGVAAHHIDEECLYRKPAPYFKYKIRVIVDFFNLGAIGQNCLEAQET
jgi:hypothetical protein